jgi:hypothetical protein
MERRFQIRLDELLADAVVPGNLVRGLMPRLQSFLQPFVAALRTAEQRINAQQYVSGLLSDLESKDITDLRKMKVSSIFHTFVLTATETWNTVRASAARETSCRRARLLSLLLLHLRWDLQLWRAIAKRFLWQTRDLLKAKSKDS